MKYLVFEDWKSECDSGNDFHLFNSFEKAKEFFDKELETTKGWVGDLTDTDRYISELTGEDYYEEYEEGYWMCNHFVMYIKKLECEA